MPTEEAQAEFDKLFADTRISDRHPEDIRADSSRAAASSSSNARRDSSRAIRSSNRRGSGDSDSDTATTTTAFSKPGDLRSRYYIPSIRSEANTGPKGVIADAQAFEDAKRAAKHSSIFQRGRDALTSRRRKSASPAAQQGRTLSSDSQGSEEGTSDIEDGMGEEGFISAWREGRLREMQGHYEGRDLARAADRRHASPSMNRKTWGSLVTVDAEGYLDAVEKVGRDVVVVVMIYDDESEVSLAVEDCLRQLAWKHQRVRFVKLHYEEAEMDEAGVPAVLAYRGGDKFAGMVPVLEELGETEELSAESLGAAMRRHRIL